MNQIYSKNNNLNKLLLKINWKKEFPNTIFFRDYEDLPRKSPFDIDIFIELSDRELVKTITKIAKSNNLLHFIKKTSSYCLILIFDLSKEKKKEIGFFTRLDLYFTPLKTELKVKK